MSYTRRELLDALAAMTDDELETTIAEARNAGTETQRAVRQLFGHTTTEPETRPDPAHGNVVPSEGRNPHGRSHTQQLHQFTRELFHGRDY